MAIIPMNVKGKSKVKPKKVGDFTVVSLGVEEGNEPNSSNTLSHAISLYVALREQWAKARYSERGVCYVKVNGEFVEVRMNRPKF